MLVMVLWVMESGATSETKPMGVFIIHVGETSER